MLIVEKGKNVPRQIDHNMESVSLNLILLETTVPAPQIVNGMRWKNAVIRVNVSIVMNKRQKK